ncbi:transposase [Shewanella sp. TB4-MNA-CIBAN-0142]|uniref:transposase n=1 Tax=Shewanella sp. TB4-MNA-CIBAN-0142 TaxID=3140464 RepID=UPI003325E26E
MARYSSERKEAVLKKLLPPHNMTVMEVARSEGIAYQTLYHCKRPANYALSSLTCQGKRLLRSHLR